MPTPDDPPAGGVTTAAVIPSARVRVDIGALTSKGSVRENNEDAYVVFRTGRYLKRIASSIPEADLPSRYEDAGHLMIVADGMGGHAAGEVASRNALIRTFQLVMQSPHWALNLEDPATRELEIRGLVERSQRYLSGAHAALVDQASRNPDLVGMGTTFTGAYSVGGDLFVLHVGDSKAYLLRDGKLARITHDHTVAQQYADLGVIPQEQVSKHHAHHVLTRAVGGPHSELEGDTHHLLIANDDRLLLCSDGLTDMAEEEEIAEVLAAHPESENACRALVELALECGGRDNVTVIVARYVVQ